MTGCLHLVFGPIAKVIYDLSSEIPCECIESNRDQVGVDDLLHQPGSERKLRLVHSIFLGLAEHRCVKVVLQDLWRCIFNIQRVLAEPTCNTSD